VSGASIAKGCATTLGTTAIDNLIYSLVFNLTLPLYAAPKQLINCKLNEFFN